MDKPGHSSEFVDWLDSESELAKAKEISYREMVEMMIGMNRHIALLEECILELSESQDYTLKESIKARVDSCKMPQSKHYRFIHEVRSQLDAHDVILSGLTKKRDYKRDKKYD